MNRKPLIIAVTVVGLLAAGWFGLELMEKRDRAAFRRDLGAKRLASIRLPALTAEQRSQLIARAKDADPRIRYRALQYLSDGSDVLPLILAAAHDSEPVLRQYAGFRLSGIEDAAAGKALDDAARRKDLAVVAGAWQYFTGPFATRKEQQLVADSFHDYGNETMMRALLNDRRLILSGGAQSWAGKNGYMVLPNYR